MAATLMLDNTTPIADQYRMCVPPQTKKLFLGGLSILTLEQKLAAIKFIPLHVKELFLVDCDSSSSDLELILAAIPQHISSLNLNSHILRRRTNLEPIFKSIPA